VEWADEFGPGHHLAGCVIVTGQRGRPRNEIRTFGTTTDDLLTSAAWLAEQGVTHVALESTGAM
jgi:transposase